ncbi:MAG: hypothetical protein B0D94_00505 [Candidatus Sedimenticola endophacoides]|nr:MAG: hypothetical protein B0D94_00505 [Candidatus Sedimenticola endophacoides]
MDSAAVSAQHAPGALLKVKKAGGVGTVNLRSGKIPITWHRVTRHFQNIEYRPGIEQKLFHFLWD